MFVYIYVFIVQSAGHKSFKTRELKPVANNTKVFVYSIN